MKVFVVVLMLICASKAVKNIPIDDIETYLNKFILDDLTEDEEASLREILEVLSSPEYAPAIFKHKYTEQKTLRPIIAFIIRNTPKATPQEFCAHIMQTAEADICPHNNNRFNWTVNLPVESETVVRAERFTRKPFKAAILSDVHMDPLYEPNGVANCNAPTCCRKGQIPKYRKVVLDRSLQHTRGVENASNTAPAGYWGDYRNCDTPIWTYNDVIERISEDHQDIDMVYYLGDTIDHGIWETTYDLNLEMNSYLIEKMRTTFGAHVLVVPTIGNHDAQPVNLFSPNYVVQEHNTTWLYKALADRWGHYLTDEAKTSLLVRGDYSLRPIPGLKIIVINNNVAQRYNWWVIFDPLDAKKHLDWLIQELYESELAGEKVHILAHVPPGSEDLTYTWTREYNRIVKRFSSTITAEFNGHTHDDSFKLFYSTDGAPINVAWNAGGVTTYDHYNPNYKIVDIDISSFEVTSMQSYYYNMTEANLNPSRRPEWKQLYDLKQVFDLPDLSPVSIDTLVNSMTVQEKYLDLYAAFSSKLNDVRLSKCFQECKSVHLCNIVITELWDRKKCDTITSLLLKGRA